ncbi:MAG TPA: polymer-forming cytoskeletal protein [Patescibacteria group bacterium]|nr:polymer-forming cytoskeletal protein [Patescibacteria group bacterium]
MFNPKTGTEGHGGGTTIIAQGVKVEGEFSSQSDVVVEGEVHGTFATTGLLTVTAEAKIKADVTAGEAVVSGTVEGNLVVHRRLDVKATAKIMGDVSAETVSVEAGAVLAGRVSIGIKGAIVEKPTLSSRRERAAAAAALVTNER